MIFVLDIGLIIYFVRMARNYANILEKYYPINKKLIFSTAYSISILALITMFPDELLMYALEIITDD